MNILEQWRDVIGFEGFYQVSDGGNVRSCDRVIIRSFFESKIKGFNRKQFIDPDGYLCIRLYKNAVAKRFTTHSLVMRAFVGDGLEGFEINHKNGIKTDNRLENLEYCTSSQNTQHAYDMGLKHLPKGTLNPSAKLKESDILDIRKRLKQGEHHLAIANLYGVDRRTIYSIKVGDRWKHVD